MYVILCENYKQAVICFWIFVEMLQGNEPWCILDIWDKNNFLSTTDGFSYIFIDHRFRSLFSHKGVEFIDEHDFIEGMFIE